jgi:hypothetical protein
LLAALGPCRWLRISAKVKAASSRLPPDALHSADNPGKKATASFVLRGLKTPFGRWSTHNSNAKLDI